MLLPGSTSRSLSHPSRSWVPYAASVAAVQEDVLRVNEDNWVNLLLIICIIMQNTPTKTPKTHGTNSDTGLTVHHSEISCSCGVKHILLVEF
jgi:hypothetical protein